jgi:hypothetical protein
MLPRSSFIFPSFFLLGVVQTLAIYSQSERTRRMCLIEFLKSTRLAVKRKRRHRASLEIPISLLRIERLNRLPKTTTTRKYDRENLYVSKFLCLSLTVSNKFQMTIQVNIILLRFQFNILIISTIIKRKKIDVFRFDWHSVQ